MIQHLSLLASGDLHALVLADRLDPRTTVCFTDRVDLADQLVALAAKLPRQPRTLDLVGLTGRDKLLGFHGRPLDTNVARVRAFFRELAEQGVLAELGISALRLVGCMTASGERARQTLATLAEITGLEVTGTHDLVSIDDLATTGYEASVVSDRRELMLLDLDALVPRSLAVDARALDHATGRELLALVRRTAGVVTPSLLAVPHAELGLPSAAAGQYHHLELLLDYELVRVNLRGTSVVYPVDDPRALRALLER